MKYEKYYKGRNDLFSGIVLSAFSIAYLIGATRIKIPKMLSSSFLNASSVPKLWGTLLLILGIILVIRGVRVMKAEKAAGQQVSESDTETEIGMNPPEVRAGDDYETPHPEGITSICYSCTEYETCNVKTGTCTSCDQYKNRAEAYKTEEQRYNEEQDAIDRETKKKLREQAEEEKMNNLPSDTQENGQKVHHIKLGATFFEEVASGEKTFELRKNDRGYKKGDILEMMEHRTHRESACDIYP